MIARRAFFALAAGFGLTRAAKASPSISDKMQPGDHLELARYPDGYSQCGRKIACYIVQPDLSLREVRTDGRRG